jgi:putative hydrolase of the HAD superfamily
MRFDAILFDAGGVLVLPDPTVLAPLLEYYGGDPDHARHVRAHYLAMKAKSAAASTEADWSAYNLAYVDAVGVPRYEHEAAAHALQRTRSALLWRWPIPDSVLALRLLHADGMPIAIVSNASGQIEEVLRRSGVCQVGAGEHTPVLTVIDSHHVGVAKPDPAIFDHALEVLGEHDRGRVAYVGDSVVMDVGGARSAGLHPILIDPYDDHLGADFDRVSPLLDLVERDGRTALRPGRSRHGHTSAGTPQATSAKRPKSVSYDTMVQRCSMASAARCASLTRFPPVDSGASSWRTTRACCGVGSTTTAGGAASQASTRSNASSMVSGPGIRPGFVARRTNARSAIQANATVSEPESASSSHVRDCS